MPKNYSWDTGKPPFVNPYNFVPLNKIDRIIDGTRTEGKLHTGYLDCRLYTLTPLAIPDTAEKTDDPQAQDHYYYPFMRINGHEMIPGSSLRGVIRSIYETVTDSCMVTSRDETFSQRVSPKEVFHPGILMRNQKKSWDLFDAKRVVWDIRARTVCNSYRVNRNNEYSWGDTVFVTKKSYGNYDKVIDIRKHEFPGAEQGYVFIGEHFVNKNAEGVFIKKNLMYEAGDPKLQTAIRGLEATLQVYKNPSVNRNLESNDHSGYKGYETAKKGGAIPIWYRKDNNGNLYLSPAAIGRITYTHTMKSFAGEPCSDRTRLCKACSLFGMIGTNDGSGYGSKVRVTDAICQNNTGTMNATLKELGSPRTSYLPFYSVDGKGYDDDGAQIRGRKFYWHNMKAQNKDKSYCAEITSSRQMQKATTSSFNPNHSRSSRNSSVHSVEKTKRNATMELLKPHAEFTFRVYFDKISTQQLQELEWALTLGENTKDSKLCYKIGHGKPLGLGSVKIVIEKQIERSFSDGSYSLQFKNVPDKIEAGTLKNSAGYQDWLTISRFDAMNGISVSYPYIVSSNDTKARKNDIASHQWFSRFKKDGCVLPTISETSEQGKLLYPYRLITNGEKPIRAKITSSARYVRVPEKNHR